MLDVPRLRVGRLPWHHEGMDRPEASRLGRVSLTLSIAAAIAAIVSCGKTAATGTLGAGGRSSGAGGGMAGVGGEGGGFADSPGTGDGAAGESGLAGSGAGGNGIGGTAGGAPGGRAGVQGGGGAAGGGSGACLPACVAGASRCNQAATEICRVDPTTGCPYWASGMELPPDRCCGGLGDVCAVSPATGGFCDCAPDPACQQEGTVCLGPDRLVSDCALGLIGCYQITRTYECPASVACTPGTILPFGTCGCPPAGDQPGLGCQTLGEVVELPCHTTRTCVLSGSCQVWRFR